MRLHLALYYDEYLSQHKGFRSAVGSDRIQPLWTCEALTVKVSGGAMNSVSILFPHLSSGAGEGFAGLDPQGTSPEISTPSW